MLLLLLLLLAVAVVVVCQTALLLSGRNTNPVALGSVWLKQSHVCSAASSVTAAPPGLREQIRVKLVHGISPECCI